MAFFNEDKKEKEKDNIEEDVNFEELISSKEEGKEEELEFDGSTPSTPITNLNEFEEELEFDESTPITENENISSNESDLPPNIDFNKEDKEKEKDNASEEYDDSTDLELRESEIEALSSIRNVALKTGKILDEKAKEEAMLEAQSNQRGGGGSGISFPKIFNRKKKYNLHPSKIIESQAIKLSNNYHGLVRSEQELLRHKDEFSNAIERERKRNSGFDTRMKTLEKFKKDNQLLNNVDALDMMNKSKDQRIKSVVNELNRDIKDNKYINNAYIDMKKSLSNYGLNSDSISKGVQKLMKNGVEMFGEDQLKTLYDNAMERNQKLQKEMSEQELKTKNDKSFQDKLKEIGNNFSNMFNSLIDAVKKMAGLGMKR